MILPNIVPSLSKNYKSPKDKCIEKGGSWDGTKCILPTSNKDNLPKQSTNNPLNLPTKNEQDIFNPQQPQQQPIKETKKKLVTPTGYRVGNDIVTKEEYEKILSQAQADADGARTYADFKRQERAAVTGEELAGQVGQFDKLGVTPNSLDYGEIAATTIAESIPDALKWIGGVTATGTAIGAAAGPAGATAGAAFSGLGATLITAGVVSKSIISNIKSQRRDMTAESALILQDGKSNLQAAVTGAAGDPNNKLKYLNEYNTELARIDQAYQQLILDSNNDIAKFENGVRDLNEFKEFYNKEKILLDLDMQAAIRTPVDPSYSLASYLAEIRSNDERN